MKTTRRVDTVKCDNCGTLEDNPKNWFSVAAHFDVQDYGSYSNGALNTQINFRHYDFCSLKCAEQGRNKLLTIVSVVSY